MEFLNGAAAIKTEIKLVQQCEVVLNAFKNLASRFESESSFLRFPFSYVHLPILTMHIKSQGWIMKPISHKLQRHGQIPLRFRPHEYESKRGKVTARDWDKCGWKNRKKGTRRMKDKDGADEEQRCWQEGKESPHTFTPAVVLKSFAF